MLGRAVRHSATLTEAIRPAVLATPLAALVAMFSYAAVTVVGVRLLSIGLREGYHPVRSRVGWQLWATERLMDAARDYLFPVYASLITPWWLRLLGAKVGDGTEISTALVIPKFTTIADGAFLADDTMVASYELGGGWIHVALTTIGKRAFLGNSGITQPGRRVPDNSLVAVLSTAPHKAKTGSSWLGSPPVRLRRKAADLDAERTFEPPLRLKLMRAVMETFRLIPVVVTFAIGAGVLGVLQWGATRFGYGWTALGSGVMLLTAGAVMRRQRGGGEMADRGPDPGVTAPAVVVVRVAQRSLRRFRRDGCRPVVRPRRNRHPGDEPVAAGARRDHRPGVWCETYWLPEADLVTLSSRRDGEPRLRGADPPVPRPDHADGHRHAGCGCHAGTQLCGIARGTAGRRLPPSDRPPW